MIDHTEAQAVEEAKLGLDVAIAQRNKSWKFKLLAPVSRRLGLYVIPINEFWAREQLAEARHGEQSQVRFGMVETPLSDHTEALKRAEETLVDGRLARELGRDVIELATENEVWQKVFDAMEDAWRDRVYKLQDENQRIEDAWTAQIKSDRKIKRDLQRQGDQLRQDNQKLIEALKPFTEIDLSTLRGQLGSITHSWMDNATKVLSEIEQRND